MRSPVRAKVNILSCNTDETNIPVQRRLASRVETCPFSLHSMFGLLCHLTSYFQINIVVPTNSLLYHLRWIARTFLCPSNKMPFVVTNSWYWRLRHPANPCTIANLPILSSTSSSESTEITYMTKSRTKVSVHGFSILLIFFSIF